METPADVFVYFDTISGEAKRGRQEGRSTRGGEYRRKNTLKK